MNAVDYVSREGSSLLILQRRTRRLPWALAILAIYAGIAAALWLVLLLSDPPGTQDLFGFVYFFLAHSLGALVLALIYSRRQEIQLSNGELEYRCKVLGLCVRRRRFPAGRWRIEVADRSKRQDAMFGGPYYVPFARKLQIVGDRGRRVTLGEGFALYAEDRARLQTLLEAGARACPPS